METFLLSIGFDRSGISWVKFIVGGGGVLFEDTRHRAIYNRDMGVSRFFSAKTGGYFLVPVWIIGLTWGAFGLLSEAID